MRKLLISLIFLFFCTPAYCQTVDSTFTDSSNFSLYSNSISTFTLNSDYLEFLPTRGLKNILSLSPGIVLHNDKLYARGSRDDEIQYLIDGVPVTDVMNGGYLIELPQEAFERIDIQTGGVSVKYGNANSGFVFQKLKRGTNEFKADIKYQSDNITFKNSSNAFDGEKRLGTYWFGHNVIIGQLSGPIIKDKLTFYTLAHYKYERDQNPQAFPGVSMGPYYDEFTDSSITFILPSGAQRDNSLERYNLTGNLFFDLSSLEIKLSGIYSYEKKRIPNRKGVQNYLQPFNYFNSFRNEVQNSSYINGSINVDYDFDKKTHVDFLFSYSSYEQKNYDPLLKDDFLNYYDSLSNINIGVDYYHHHNTINIYDLRFTRPGVVTSSYAKHIRNSLHTKLSIQRSLTDNLSLMVGGEYHSESISQYELTNSNLKNIGGHINSPIYDSLEDILWLQFFNNYGYDIYGNKVESIDIHGPRKPFRYSGFLEGSYVSQYFNIAAGLRYDYYRANNYEYNTTLDNAEIWQTLYDRDKMETAFMKTGSHYTFSPRITITTKFDEANSVYLHYGKYTQQVKFSNYFRGMNNQLDYILGDPPLAKPLGYDLIPISTKLSEMGIKLNFDNSLSVNAKLFYKYTSGLPILYYDGYLSTHLHISYNGGETTTKGIDFGIGYKNENNVQILANLSFQNSEGASIYFDSWLGWRSGNYHYIPEPLTNIQTENNYDIKGNLICMYNTGNTFNNNLHDDVGISVILSFNSGHPYTKYNLTSGYFYYYSYNREVIGERNEFTTPWFFQFDLRIDKTFEFINKSKIRFELSIINLFDSMNTINVFSSNGKSDNDDFLNTDRGLERLSEYGEEYAEFYNIVNVDYYSQYKQATCFNLFGPPRQIFFGVTLEY